MKNLISCILVLFLTPIAFVNAQDADEKKETDYIEFNDRNNVVHGVYIGLSARYGKIENKDTYITGLKVAYVADQKFEIGLEVDFLFSEQEAPSNYIHSDLIGAYVGIHQEPILFSKSRVNLSFPLLLGVGAVDYERDITGNNGVPEDIIELIFVAEPGVSALFNISRYLQLEAGIKYRFSDKLDTANSSSTLDRINGFSAGIGLKVGVFNMGRNRYKKKIED